MIKINNSGVEIRGQLKDIKVELTLGLASLAEVLIKEGMPKEDVYNELHIMAECAADTVGVTKKEEENDRIREAVAAVFNFIVSDIEKNKEKEEGEK